MFMNLSRKALGIPLCDLGARDWRKYDKAFTFNITVNDMHDVVDHKDVGFGTNARFGIQSSCSRGGYRVAIK